MPVADGREVTQDGVPTADGALEVTSDVAILMYHSIATQGPPELAPYRLTPAAFKAQLNFLKQAGYHSIGLNDWVGCVAQRGSWPGRPIIITFDDGYQDFAEHAWPLLEQAGFTATMFVVTDKVGGVADWDDIAGERPRLMDWEILRLLQSRGLQFGSHTARHPSLTALSHAEIVAEAERSRATLLDRLGIEVTALAFPFGHWNDSVCAAIAEAGYVAGVTTFGGISTTLHNPLSLPRIEVFPQDDLQAFAAKVTCARPRLPALQSQTSGVRTQAPGFSHHHSRGNAMVIHPDYAEKLAAQLDRLVGEFAALHSQLLNAGTGRNGLQQKLAQIFRQPLTGPTSQGIAPYHLLAPDVRVGFEPAAQVSLRIDPKRDHAASPETCLNTLEFAFSGDSAWLSIEAICDWPDLSSARQFQLGIYAGISKTTLGRAVLRLPQKDGGNTDVILTGFELSSEGRSFNKSGVLKLPDFVNVNMDQRPMLIVFLETREDIVLRLNYLSVYFE